jgi:hypothetical protein
MDEGVLNSVDDFLRPQQKNKFVEFLIGFFLPIVLLIVVLLILSILYSSLGEGVYFENEDWVFDGVFLSFLIIGLGLLSCLTIVPITSSVIAIKSSNPTITARGYGAISIVIIWIVSIFFLFLILF